MARTIFDIGLHDGSDTSFYLRKGFKVVAVDADIRFVRRARLRFWSSIRRGHLTLVYGAIHDRDGEVVFYRNLDKDDWSSTDVAHGTRAGTRHVVLKVPAVRLRDLVAAHGCPYYLKSDVEGADRHVLADLALTACRPRYLSIEAHTADYLDRLEALGYDGFKLVNQTLLRRHRPPRPPREGRYVRTRFTGHSSGPFGEETPGDWSSRQDIARAFAMITELQARQPHAIDGWFDIHATPGLGGGR